MSETPSLFSFIVPVFNTGEYLFETLDSINNQDCEKNLIQTIIINDCSTDVNTINIIHQLKNDGYYKDIKLDIIENPKNLWLAETRNIGVKHAKGKYIICLDSDDTIESDFLSLSYFTFKSHEKCSWVYPSLRKFGFRNEEVIAPDFSAKKLFLNNYSSVCSMMTIDLWKSLNGQQTIVLNNKIKMYEDWDFWQRALKKGKYGTAIKKPIFNYRQNISSLVTRTEEEGNLSMLMAMRKNWTSIFGLHFSQKAYKKNKKNESKFNFFDKVFRKLIKISTGRNPANFNIKELIYFLFIPNSFIKNRLNNTNQLNKTLKIAGFNNNFKLELDPEKTISATKSNKKKILVSHFFWAIGGAEVVLLNYLTVLKNNNYEIIDVVVENTNINNLKLEFNKVCSRQYNLSDLSEFNYSKLLALWEIIKFEQPDILFNMSNPFAYILMPEIKMKLKNIKTIDLLHAEEFNNNGWFEGAKAYQNYIDKRIVISEFWKSVLMKKYGESEYKINVIYNKTIASKFISNPEIKRELRKKYNIKDNIKVIGYLGRLDFPKQPEVLIEVSKIMSHNSEFLFVIIGGGKKIDPKEYSKLNNLIFLPESKNPEILLQLFDVAVFPSLFEGYPITSLECAALNIPIIASNIIGFDEQINNGNFGMLYKIQNIELDAQKITKILENNYQELINLGANGRKFVTEFHNEIKIDQEIIAAFNFND